MEHTSQIPDENFTGSHLVKIAHINTIPGKSLRVKHGGARMNEDPPIFLIEIFDGLCIRIEFHGAGHGGCEFLVRKIDSR